MAQRKRVVMAFCISTLLHSAILLPWPNFNRLAVQSELYPLEITYYQIVEDIAEAGKTKSLGKKTLEVGDIAKRDREAAQKTKTQHVKLQKRDVKVKGESEAEKSFSLKNFSAAEKELYLSYYDVIREGIRLIAERYYQNYIGRGDIHLQFAVRSNGALINVSILEEGTYASSVLRRIALQSVKGANPFPTFPEELRKEKLSFNVVISFKNEK